MKKQRFVRSAIALACAGFLLPISAAWATDTQCIGKEFEWNTTWTKSGNSSSSTNESWSYLAKAGTSQIAANLNVSISGTKLSATRSDSNACTYTGNISGTKVTGTYYCRNGGPFNFSIDCNKELTSTTPATPTLTRSTPYGTSAGSTVILSISPAQADAKYQICISSMSLIIDMGCQEVSSLSTPVTLQPTWDYYLTAKMIVNGVESKLSNEVHVVTDKVSQFKYPVILVHGLSLGDWWSAINSSHSTWKEYGAWTQKVASYGGTLVAKDKFHVLTTGKFANTNLPSDNIQSGCPTEKDVTGLFDIQYYYGCNPQGGYFTMNFSSGNDLSFTAQAMELRAIVDAVTKLTGKPKVFLVGHSMGGLASRAYVQYLGGGSKVAGLITIGTPHQGALSAIGATVWTLSADVKQMLAPNSVDLNMLNDLNANPWNPDVKTYAIAFTNDGESDAVVSASSQRNSLLGWDGYTVRASSPNLGHMSETSDATIRSLVQGTLLHWSE